MEKIPRVIRRYLDTHIKDAEITFFETKFPGDTLQYIIDAETDNYLYHLEFDVKCRLIRKSAEKRFRIDYTDENYLDD